MLNYPMHNKLHSYYKDANAFYKNNEAFYSIDDSWDGFSWINADDCDNNILSFIRKGKNGQEIIAIISFNGADVNDYKININRGKYKVVFNSDSLKYGGGGKLKKRIFNSTKTNRDKIEGFKIDIPKLSCIYLEKQI